MRRAFTLVELLVVVAIIALLLAILLPAMDKARQAATMVACRATLSQVSTMLHTYAVDYNGVMPQGVHAGNLPGVTNRADWMTFLSLAGYDQITYTMSTDSHYQRQAIRCPLLGKRSYAVFVGNNLDGEFTHEPFGPGGFKFNGLRPAGLPSPAGYAHAGCGVRSGGSGVMGANEQRGASGFRSSKWINLGGQRDTIWMGHVGQTNLIFADGHGAAADPQRLLEVSNYSPHAALNNRGIDNYWDAEGVYTNIISPP